MTQLTIESNTFTIIQSIASHTSAIESKLLETYYAKNVFLMMKYRAENEALSRHIIEILKRKGLNCVRADMPEWNLTKDDVLNPLAVLYCCKYGIALFDEPEDGQNYSPNVAYELGIMHYQQKDCLILINQKIEAKKPFDLISRLHSTYAKELDIEKLIDNWIMRNNIITNPIVNNTEKVAIALIKKGKKYLITKRRQQENDLLWGFPAKRLKPKANEKKALESEVFAETNVKINVVSHLGHKNDLGKKCELSYWYCEYLSGRIKNKDEAELEIIKWVSGSEAKNLITSELFPEIKRILDN